MNSIAIMTKKKPGTSRPTPTKESMIILAALQNLKATENITQQDVAAQVGVEAANISHWAQGVRPVPATKAAKLAEAIRVADPATISVKYAEVQQGALTAGNVVPLRQEQEPSLRADLVIARLKNDVQALSYALSSLVVTMTAHRPAEALDAAKALRRAVPPKFRDRGLVFELLSTLDRAGKA